VELANKEDAERSRGWVLDLLGRMGLSADDALLLLPFLHRHGSARLVGEDGLLFDGFVNVGRCLDDVRNDLLFVDDGLDVFDDFLVHGLFDDRRQQLLFMFDAHELNLGLYLAHDLGQFWW